MTVQADPGDGLDIASGLPQFDNARASLRALGRGWWVILMATLLGGSIALGISLIQTPRYQANAMLYVTSGSDDNSTAAYQGSLASQQRVASYSRLVSTDAVIDQALKDSNLPLSRPQAKKAVTGSANTDTVLLEISATDRDKAIAERLADAVARSMIAYVAKLETPGDGAGQPLAKLTLVSPATAGSSPVTPKTILNVIVGLVAGLILGVLGVLTRERFSSRVHDEAELEHFGSTPVLGTVPTDDALKNHRVVDFGKGGPAAEAFRQVRTNLAFTNVDNPATVVLVTSPVAAEGKTTTATNLAASLVEDGHRVALLDADLRRPQIGQRMGVVKDLGLTTWLRSDSDIAELVQPTQLDELWTMASGPKPPNPAELLGSRKAATAIQELRKSFDYVIVDTPPILPVTDALVLSRHVDGVILVARAGKTRSHDLRDAYKAVLKTKKPILGFVLTNAQLARRRYGYYGNGDD